MNKEQWITKRWEHKESRRYYKIFLQRSLIGWEVLRCWGGINQATGNKMVVPCESYQEALNQLSMIEKQRQRKNYALVLDSQ
ncbi:MAG: WGR domain-containing protein [Gammaproteobacteria bacterium]|nr:WGR domain-containing protein [Gammaproteobacteria bacterium]